MITPPDGQSPRMQMYLFDNPVVNSGDDAAVVYHEYMHGLSNRLHNNGLGGGLVARQSRAMGEGWSDFYSMDYLVEQGFVTDTAAEGEVVAGDYVTNDTPTGIRTNAIDCPIGSANATNCPGTAGAGPGGHDFGDMGKVIAYNGNTSFPFFQVHADGEIWSETLWDLRKLIGAAATRGLVTEAMRLSPASPPFLDSRDAILLADQVAGGTYHTQIWTVFAARGMGYGATVTSAESTRGQADFNTPPASIATASAPTVTDPAPLGDADGNAESGETVLLRIPVRNTTAAQLTGVKATLTSSTPGVVVGQPTVAYPDLAVKAIDTGDIPFAVTLPTSLPCATIVALSLAVHADQGDSAAQPLTLDLGALSGTTYTATGVPAPIPDFSVPGTTVTLSVPDAATINKLRVTVSTTHNFIGDLHGRLTAPDGTIVELFERPGGGSFGAGIAGMTGVVFDDAAPSKIQDLPAWNGGPSTPAISGPYKPNEPLSRLSRAPADGHLVAAHVRRFRWGHRLDHRLQRPESAGTPGLLDDRHAAGAGDAPGIARGDDFGDAERHGRPGDGEHRLRVPMGPDDGLRQRRRCRHRRGEQRAGPAPGADRRARREHDLSLPARRAARGHRRDADA